VVQTLTFKTLYVPFFIEHARRRLVHVNISEHPTVAWVWQQLRNATPDGKQPRYLIHDRNGVWHRLRRTDGEARHTRDPDSCDGPRANAVAERMVGTFRRECLVQMIELNEQQLRSLLREFVVYYNRGRPQRSLALQTPEVRDRRRAGTLVCRPVLGGAPSQL
jgi:putative transposase